MNDFNPTYYHIWRFRLFGIPWIYEFTVKGWNPHCPNVKDYDSLLRNWMGTWKLMEAKIN